MTEQEDQPKKRGRPLGSKNKAKPKKRGRPLGTTRAWASGKEPKKATRARRAAPLMSITHEPGKPGRPVGSKTVNYGMSRFKSAVEAGFDAKLVQQMIDAVSLMGDTEAKLRFLTISKDLRGPPTVSEERFPAALVRKLRVAAETLGIHTVYVPRALRADSSIVDDVGVRWLYKHGFSHRTMADVFDCTATMLAKKFGSSKKQPSRVEQIRDASKAPEAYKAGLAWLKGVHKVAAVKLNEEFGPSRIARCGEAVLAFQAALGRDPMRVAR
jgi:hypothetical protein